MICTIWNLFWRSDHYRKFIDKYFKDFVYTLSFIIRANETIIKVCNLYSTFVAFPMFSLIFVLREGDYKKRTHVNFSCMYYRNNRSCSFITKNILFFLGSVTMFCFVVFCLGFSLAQKKCPSDHISISLYPPWKILPILQLNHSDYVGPNHL